MKWKLRDFLNAVFQDNNHEHQGIVAKLLLDKTRVKPGRIVCLMYKHSSSHPKSKVSEEAINDYTQPAIFAWALDIVLYKMTSEVKKFIHDPELYV